MVALQAERRGAAQGTRRASARGSLTKPKLRSALGLHGRRCAVAGVIFFLLSLGCLCFLPVYYRSNAVLRVSGLRLSSGDVDTRIKLLQVEFRRPDIILPVLTLAGHSGATQSAGTNAGHVLSALRFAADQIPGDVRVSFDWPDQRGATAILSALVGQLSKTSAGGSDRTELLQELRQSAVDAAQAQNALVIAQRSTASLTGHIDTTTAAASAQTELIAAKADLARLISSTHVAASSDTGQDTSAPALLQALIKTRDETAQNRADLSTRYGPKYPAMQEMDHLLAVLDTQIAAAKQQQADHAAATAAARKHIVLLQASLANDRAMRSETEEMAALVSELTSNAQAAQNRYLLRAERLRELASERPLGLEVVSAPGLGIRVPSIGLVLLIATGVGGLAAMITLLISELRTKGFRNPARAELGLGIAAATLVPEIDMDDDEVSTIDQIVNRPSSHFSKSFKRLLKHLLENQEGDLLTSLSISSALPAEGKTTVSICLARAAAQSGRSVIMVDCDGRRASLSKAVPGTARPGLVEVLEDGAALEKAIERDELSGAYVLRHSATDRIFDVGQPAAMSDLLMRLKQSFDLVLLDTAPVLALAEARVVAALTDQVLLVVRWRITPRAATQTALKLLVRAGADVRAFVMTRASFA